jgi:chromosome segregation ATPase
MAEQRDTVTNELLLEPLKSIEAKLDRLQGDMLEVKERLGILEMQYASLSRRVDRIDERVERIERRLDLVEG